MLHTNNQTQLLLSSQARPAMVIGECQHRSQLCPSDSKQGLENAHLVFLIIKCRFDGEFNLCSQSGPLREILLVRGNLSLPDLLSGADIKVRLQNVASFIHYVGQFPCPSQVQVWVLRAPCKPLGCESLCRSLVLFVF